MSCTTCQNIGPLLSYNVCQIQTPSDMEDSNGPVWRYKGVTILKDYRVKLYIKVCKESYIATTIRCVLTWTSRDGLCVHIECIGVGTKGSPRQVYNSHSGKRFHNTYQGWGWKGITRGTRHRRGMIDRGRLYEIYQVQRIKNSKREGAFHPHNKSKWHLITELNYPRFINNLLIYVVC